VCRLSAAWTHIKTKRATMRTKGYIFVEKEEERQCFVPELDEGRKEASREKRWQANEGGAR